MSGDVVERLRAGEMVGEVVGFMHPTADWCHRDYSAVSAHCQIGGLAPVSLIRQSEAASLVAQLTNERDTAQTTRDAARENFLTMQGAAAELLKRAETAERLLAGVVEAADQWNASQDQAAFTALSSAIDAARTLTNGGENVR